jgi:hypothetical protein
MVFNRYPDGWGYMTPEILNRNNSKGPGPEIFLSWIYSSQSVLELYLVVDFYFKNAVLGDFPIKM